MDLCQIYGEGVFDPLLRRISMSKVKVTREKSVLHFYHPPAVYGMYRQSEKKLVKQQYLPYMSPQYGESLAAEIVSLVGAPRVISTGFASWQRYSTAV